MIKKIVFVLSAIVLVLIQSSFLHEFVVSRNSLNIIVISTILLSVLISWRTGIFFAIITGLLIDLYAPFGYGTITIALLATVGVLYNLFRKLLARKTTSSIILSVAIGTIIYYFMITIITYAAYLLGWNQTSILINGNYLALLIIQIIFHSLITFVFLIVINIVAKRLKATFFISEKV